MTLSQEEFQTFGQVNPFSGNPWTESEIKAMREGQAKQELIRQDCVSQYSPCPLYQAMAAKDPDYWKNFPTGRVNLRNNNAT
jgi:hypothetical protein